MTLQTKHTETPWEVVKYETEITVAEHLTGRSICDIVGDMKIDEANAQFIVTAVNSHYELLEACKEALEWQTEYYKQSGDTEATITMHRLQRVIEKAGAL